MPRSRTAAALAVATAALCLACSAAPRDRARTFAPGEQVSRAQATQVELAEAHYEERHLTLRISLTNHADEPLTLAREGLLLAYEDLEFPVAQDTQMPVPASVSVPPGQTVELWITFAPGTPVATDATLRLRTLERSGRPLEVLSLPVPGPA